MTLKVIEEFKINGFSQKDVILRPGYRMQYMGQLNDLEITSPVSKATSVADWEEIVKEYEKPTLVFILNQRVLQSLVLA